MALTLRQWIRDGMEAPRRSPRPDAPAVASARAPRPRVSSCTPRAGLHPAGPALAAASSPRADAAFPPGPRGPGNAAAGCMGSARAPPPFRRGAASPSEPEHTALLEFIPIPEQHWFLPWNPQLMMKQ